MIILEEKKSLRKKVRDFEKSYLGELGELDLSLCENILSLPEYRSAQSIFAFVPFGNEPNILCVLEDALLKERSLRYPAAKRMGRWRLL